MKKLWLLSALILSTSSLSSEEIGVLSTDADELARSFLICEPKPKENQECISCTDPLINYRLPADFTGYDSFVEYLIWQTQMQPTFFVANNTSSTFDNNYPNTYAQGFLREQSFKWSSGIRLGVGYSFERDTWQVLGQYTWYNTEGHNWFKVKPPLVTAEPRTFVGSNYLMPLTFKHEGVGVVRASSKGHFSYQVWDLLLSSALLATEQIQFNYSLGLTGAYIKQNQDVVYQDAPPVPGSFPPNNGYFHNHWKFGGGGFRAGLDTNWHLGRGFGVFGKMSFAAILGQYRLNTSITSDGPFINFYDFIIQDARFKKVMLLPTSQFIFGFDWNKTFDNCWISSVTVSLAGEFNHLTNLQQIFKSNSDTGVPFAGKPSVRDVGSVYMYGGTAHVGADF